MFEFDTLILYVYVLEFILLVLLCIILNQEALNIRIAKIIVVLYFITLLVSIILEKNNNTSKYYETFQDTNTNTTNIITYIINNNKIMNYTYQAY